MTKVINAAVILYGVLCIALGVQAYFFPHEGAKVSPASLIAGGLLGVLSIASYVVWTKNPRAGRIMGLVAPIIALGKFIPAYMKDTSKFYPAGIMVVASVLLVILLGSGHMMAKKNASTEA